MSKYSLFLTLLSVFGAVACGSNAQVDVSVKEGMIALHAQQQPLLEQGYTSVRYERQGEVFVVDSRQHPTAFEQASFSDERGSGARSVSTTTDPQGVRVLTLIESYNNQPYVLVRSAIDNQSGADIRVQSIEPIKNGVLLSKADWSQVRLVDGNSGGEPSFLMTDLPLYCRNNVLVSEGQGAQTAHVVAGGVAYSDFEKFVEVSPRANRRSELGSDVVAYMNLPMQREDGLRPFISMGQGHRRRFEDQPTYHWKHFIFNSSELIINLMKLDPKQQYTVGLSWSSDNDDRAQSVWADNGPQTAAVQLTQEPLVVPNFKTGTLGAQVELAVPSDLVARGDVRILVRKEGASNVVVGEAWLRQAGHTPSAPQIDAQDTRAAITLIAQDPVGKLVAAGEKYQPTDAFYLDGLSKNPFEALELYGQTLAKEQKVNLQYYTFPSVCLWYAQHHYYGGGPSINNSPGAVREMERVVESGFLKYETAAIRLVPDCYEINNQQGWWSEERFGMHGSGHAVPGEIEVDAHYKPPYETTAKWAGTITQMGGIPLLYVQTGKRSQDYADAHPNQMLFNEASHYIPDADWTVLNKSSYDFTDPDFVAHMQEVYGRFSQGGLQGLMFDYTNTGWPIYGGMEDRSSTASAAYRKVYQLARQGMGPDAYIHERCLERGTDLTVGIVSSQRIWGDTDDVTPEMVTRGGLRWYKNRVAVGLDMDAKNLHKAKPNANGNPDGRRKMLTMTYVASSRLLLANSFANIKDSVLWDLSRLFPMHTMARSARPIDMLDSAVPHIYNFKVADGWNQVTLYNDNNQEPLTLSAAMSTQSAKNSYAHLELDPKQRYHAYDFWNNTYCGIVSGAESLTQELRPGEARMISLRQVAANPQVISTDRHLMQGLVELSDVVGSKSGIHGKATTVAGELMTVVVALNGAKAQKATVSPGAASMHVDGDLAYVQLLVPEGGVAQWDLEVE